MLQASAVTLIAFQPEDFQQSVMSYNLNFTRSPLAALLGTEGEGSRVELGHSSGLLQFWMTGSAEVVAKVDGKMEIPEWK